MDDELVELFLRLLGVLLLLLLFSVLRLERLLLDLDLLCRLRGDGDLRLLGDRDLRLGGAGEYRLGDTDLEYDLLRPRRFERDLDLRLGELLLDLTGDLDDDRFLNRLGVGDLRLLSLSLLLGDLFLDPDLFLELDLRLFFFSSLRFDFDLSSFFLLLPKDFDLERELDFDLDDSFLDFRP